MWILQKLVISYNEFKTIAQVRDLFDLNVDKSQNIFVDITPVEVSKFLQKS